jgi:hypothetical protein
MTRRGGVNPADIRNAGQYSACCRTISLPTKWVTAGQNRCTRPSSTDPNPNAVR